MFKLQFTPEGYVFIRRDICKVSGVTAVGETPEKGLNQKTKELSVARPGAKKKLDTQYFVAESLNLSYNTMEPTVSQRKTDESKLIGKYDIVFICL